MPSNYVPLPQVQDAELKRERLDRMKRLATGLLVLVTIIFVVAHLLEKTHPSFAIVRATAEAAMVGALADWFAVTALFRYPLGIKIDRKSVV